MDIIFTFLVTKGVSSVGGGTLQYVIMRYIPWIFTKYLTCTGAYTLIQSPNTY